MSKSNISLKDVILNGGKVNHPETNLSKTEKVLVGEDVKEREDVEKTIPHYLWFEMFSVKFTAWVLLPFLIVLALHHFGLFLGEPIKVAFNLNIPFLGVLSINPMVVNWALTTVGLLLFGFACKKIGQDGAFCRKYPQESDKLYSGLYGSEVLKRIVVFYLSVAEILWVTFSLFAGGFSLLGAIAVFFGFIFSPEKFQHGLGFNPLYLFIILGSGVIWHYLFIPPQRPSRRKFGFSLDFKNFIQKETYIPYRYYGEKPKDLVPSLTFYVFHAIKVVATLLLNVMLWSFNSFKLKKALVIFLPFVWFVDLLEIIALDLFFYTLLLINYCLGWSFKILSFVAFAGGIYINTKRMILLHDSFDWYTLWLNLGILFLTIVIFTHFHHCAKFFRVIEKQRIRKPLKDFLNW